MTIVWNESRYRFVFQSHGGTVGRFLGQTAVRLESTAKVIATQEKLVRTGRYRASIRAQVVNDARGLIIKFGSPLFYARLLERGTPAHSIPLVPGRLLWWDMPNDRGWMVNPGSLDKDGNFTAHPVRRVNHPGTRPYLVLRRAILLVTKGGIAR
jgi:Bacteriophage HK97-gp10, putative tail-component